MNYGGRTTIVKSLHAAPWRSLSPSRPPKSLRALLPSPDRRPRVPLMPAAPLGADRTRARPRGRSRASAWMKRGARRRSSAKARPAGMVVAADRRPAPFPGASCRITRGWSRGSVDGAAEGSSFPGDVSGGPPPEGRPRAGLEQCERDREDQPHARRAQPGRLSTRTTENRGGREAGACGRSGARRSSGATSSA